MLALALLGLAAGLESKKQSHYTCGGVTSVHAHWEKYTYSDSVKPKNAGGIKIDVNTSHCGFQIGPIYVASIYVPPPSLPIATGTTTIDMNSKWFKTIDGNIEPVEGFTLHLWHPTKTAHILQFDANKFHWQVHWVGTYSGGATHAGKSGWRELGTNQLPNTLTLDVDTKTHFHHGANYVVTFFGIARVYGTQQIYQPKKTGFRLYATFQDKTSAKMCENNYWYVGWTAIPHIQHESASDWDQAMRFRKAIHIDIPFKRTLPVEPILVTSISMGSAQLPETEIWGANSFTARSYTGFRVYLGPSGFNGKAVSHADAWAANYAVNYVEYVPKTKPRACKVSTWSAWGTCSKSCLGGHQTRIRKITQAPWHEKCPSVKNTRLCNTQGCYKPLQKVVVAYRLTKMPSSQYLSKKLQLKMRKALARICGIPANDVHITKIKSKEHDSFKKNVMSQSYTIDVAVGLYAPDATSAARYSARIVTGHSLSLMEMAIEMRDVIQAADDDQPAKEVTMTVLEKPLTVQTKLAKHIAAQKAAAAQAAAEKAAAAKAAAAKAAAEARAIMAAQQAQLAKQKAQRALTKKLKAKRAARMALINAAGKPAHKSAHVGNHNTKESSAQQRAALMSIAGLRNRIHGGPPAKSPSQGHGHGRHGHAGAGKKAAAATPKPKAKPGDDATIFAILGVVFFIVAIGGAAAFLIPQGGGGGGGGLASEISDDDGDDNVDAREARPLKPAGDPAGLGESYSLVGAELEEPELAIARAADSDDEAC